MDIVAHGAWAWLGADALARRNGLPRAAVVGAVVAATLPDVLHLLPVAGWWCHIVIDVFTHSAAYYPVPVLYPFTQRGFDGIDWNAPWLLGINYLALAIALVWRWRGRG